PKEAMPRSSIDPGLVIASFGVVDPIKRSPMLLEAFADVTGAGSRARLALVGPLPHEVRDQYDARAAELGLAGSVTVTGRVDDDEYASWLVSAHIAVQLRASAGGEWSAAVADCLAVGLPTIVTDSGFGRDLPDDAVVKVGRDIHADELG